MEDVDHSEKICNEYRMKLCSSADFTRTRQLIGTVLRLALFLLLS
jgi:hypothetical protein